MKGQFDGVCNRTACQRSIKEENWYNSSTQVYYCKGCALGINHWSQKDDGIIVCTEVSDPNDKPAFPWKEMKAHYGVR